MKPEGNPALCPLKNAKAKLEGLFDWKSEKASDFERLGPLSIDLADIA
jgi:hypothetical protein